MMRNRMMRSGSKIFIRGDASTVLPPMALSPFSRKKKSLFFCLGKKNPEGTKLMLGCIKRNKTFPQVGVIGRCPVLRVLFV